MMDMQFRVVLMSALMCEYAFCGVGEAIAQAFVESAVISAARIVDEVMKEDAARTPTSDSSTEGDSTDRTESMPIVVTPRVERVWTPETIQKDPVQFLRDQIVACDRLKARIDTHNITLIRMEKGAVRATEESELMRVRYEKFLQDAKTAYKEAKGTWPIAVNGYNLNEDEFNEKVADAMERIELAKKEYREKLAIAKRVAIRKGVLKMKKREIVNLRMKLSQQAEAVKMNSTLAELGDLKASLTALKDMTIEIEEDPTKLSLDDLTEQDPNAKRNAKVQNFLND